MRPRLLIVSAPGCVKGSPRWAWGAGSARGAAGALIRAYRVGLERSCNGAWMKLAWQGREVPPVVAVAGRMVAVTSGYIDRVTEQVLIVHEQERDR